MSRAGGGGGAGSVIRHGHLRKLKTMKRKYFVLRSEAPESSARLEYYESEKKYKAGASPRRVISLKSCFNITRRLDLKQRYVIALYLREECFCVVMDGDEELHSWLADLLKCYRADDSAEELLQPTQHVWQVNVQKKDLGATKNILGLYNLCLTEKTLTLVKIRSNNTTVYDFYVPDRIELSLRNIRRCGFSECFFYMEVGRQTSIGPGPLWMHTEDTNIAQSMHSTIYHAMKNCTKDKDEKDLLPANRIRSASATEDPRKNALSNRRQTYCDAKNRSGHPNSAVNESLLLNNLLIQPIDSSVKLEGKENVGRSIKHHRTFSLPTGCAPFQEPLKISHERTRSAPLTGDEVDRATIEKAARHSSYKAVNGDFLSKKQAQWNRRDSTNARFPKSSPGHSKNLPAMRNRCESMPSRTCPPLEPERTPSRHQPNHIDGESRDEPDTADWHPTPGIPEEPDDISYCKMTPRDLNISNKIGGSVQHSRNSSLIDDSASTGAYVPMNRGAGDSGYVEVHQNLSPAASTGSVCSGTPSTDPRFSEYQLDPVTAHIVPDDEARPSRTYSVGSRPTHIVHAARDRAYSVGARSRARPPHSGHTSNSAPLLPRPSTDDLMELDFSNNSPKARAMIAKSPPSSGLVPPRGTTPRTYKPKVDEYVDMSPRSGYMEMRPLDASLIPTSSISIARSPPARFLSKSPPIASTPDGYVEMNYGSKKTEQASTPSRPISIIAESRQERSKSHEVVSSPRSESLILSPQTPVEDNSYRKKRNGRSIRDVTTPLGSQTIFSLSLESPASDDRHEMEAIDDFDEELIYHPLSTVCEISEDAGRKSPDVIGSPPYYATLAPVTRMVSQPIAAPLKLGSESDGDELSRNPMATKILARAGDVSGGNVNATLVRAGSGTAVARFNVNEEETRKSSSPAPTECPSLNYVALDLEPRGGTATSAAHTYAQIDFARSEKLNTADAN